MSETPTDLVEDLKDEVGDALRTVAKYEHGDYERLFIRPDIEAQYSDEERAELYHQVEIEGMGYSHFEDLFHTGDLESVIYGFEEALMFQFPGEDEFTGLFVTVDRDVVMNPESIIGTATAHV